jgi:hypothetical protein
MRRLLRALPLAAVAAAGCAGVNDGLDVSATDETTAPAAATGSVAALPAAAAAPAPSADAIPEPAPMDRPTSPRPGLMAPGAVGHWYLDREGGQRRVLTLGVDASGLPGGSLCPEDEPCANAPIDHVVSMGDGELRFRALEADGASWWIMRVTDGVARGRVAKADGDVAPADGAAYAGRFLGWRSETFDADVTPRTFALSIDGQSATLRLDRTADGGAFVGQLRIYTNADGVLAEQPIEDVAVDAWDGHSLTFTRMSTIAAARFSGTVSGRKIAGTWRDAGGGGSWTGTRAEVLGHGLTARAADDEKRWQQQTRRRLRAVAMDGNPRATDVKVATLSSGVAPFAQGELLANRDDAQASWPQAYTLSELTFDLSLPNRYGSAPLTRHLHGMMSVPTTPKPAGGYPIVVAVNGHWGSAKRLFNPSDVLYWYGEAFARRGNVVISVDVGHRPVAERDAYYKAFADGDDPAGGNGPHPAIAAAGMTGDWEEDGERTWDVQRALDYVLQRPDVNPSRVMVVGLSLGAEVADWVGALDPRVAVTIPAGDPPDFFQMYVAGNHQCWRWQSGDEREFLAPADLYALVAGRMLVRQTGIKDDSYSVAPEKFATAKQEIRHAQAAYDALGGSMIHYLHWDGHAFHFGEALPNAPADGVTKLVEVAPSSPGSMLWQDDATTVVAAPSIMGLLPWASQLL